MEDTHSVWVTSERGEKSHLVLTGSAGYPGLVLDPLSFLTGARSAIMESVSSCLSGSFSVSAAGPEERTASGSVSHRLEVGQVRLCVRLPEADELVISVWPSVIFIIIASTCWSSSLKMGLGIGGFQESSAASSGSHDHKAHLLHSLPPTSAPALKAFLWFCPEFC